MGVVELFNQIAENDFGFFQKVHAVGDMMTKEPATLSLDDTYSDAVEMFRRGGFHHAPVLNPEDQSVVGIVSDRDLLRQHPPGLGTGAERDDDHKVLQQSVSRFMTRHPVWCTKECSPIRALSLMLEHHVDSVLVSPDGQTLDGIVSPRNFLQLLLLFHRVCTRDADLRRLRLVDLDLRKGIPLDEIFSRGAQTVRDVMTKSVECVGSDERLSAAMARMQDLEIRHLPVLNGDGRLVGMLSDREILQALPSLRQRSEEPDRRFRQTLFATDDKPVLARRVDGVMREDMHAVSPDTLLTDVMVVFRDRSVSGLPVVESESGRLCGIITTSDILRVVRVVMQIGRLAEDSADRDPAKSGPHSSADLL